MIATASTDVRTSVVRATSMKEIAAVSAVVTSVTGYTDIHPAVLRTVLETGGYVAGAYDDSGACVGALYGLIGVRDGRPFLHSEMLAVVPFARGGHLARALKLDQRAFALEREIEVVTWTYDPLRGVNANLNIRRLGCEVIGYERDMYGELPGYSSGWPTDQVLLEWRVGSPRVAEVVAGTYEPGYRRAEIPNAVETSVRADGLLVFERVIDVDDPVVLIEIPDSIQAMRWLDMHAVLRWRVGIRDAFELYLGRGYEVDWFLSDLDGRRRNFYVLRRRG